MLLLLIPDYNLAFYKDSILFHCTLYRTISVSLSCVLAVSISIQPLLHFELYILWESCFGARAPIGIAPNYYSALPASAAYEEEEVDHAPLSVQSIALQKDFVAFIQGERPNVFPGLSLYARKALFLASYCSRTVLTWWHRPCIKSLA